MYPNTNFSRATVSVVAGALIAIGAHGSAWTATGFMPTQDAVATGQSCDVVIMTDTLCQSGQHRHGTAPTIGRAYRDLTPRPMA
jgi:hypothetical protein